nr:hypothetical protein [uncultured Mogibacterium sp.]
MINEDLKHIADHYGLEHQLGKCKEELSELIKAIDSLDERAIVEEVADVEIMISQIKYLMRTEPSVEIYKDYKITRQLRRISREQSNEHDN